MQVSEAAQRGVWLTVEFYIKADKLEQAEALFEQHVSDGRKDRGNLFFTMLRHRDEPNRFKSIECWETAADIENHDAQPHHAPFLAKLKELESKPKLVVKFDFFAQGTPA